MTGYQYLAVTVGLVALVAQAAPAAQAQVTETVLHAFTGRRDGALPSGTLLIGTDGSGVINGLYGTASSGDDNAACSGSNPEIDCGSVFSLLPPGGTGTAWRSHPLHDFTGYDDEDTPISGLFSATSQIGGQTPLFGTTLGSEFGYAGSVFMQVGKTLTSIWTFSYSDGSTPYGGAISDATGAVYVATESGGSYGCGTVVQLLPPAQGQVVWTENTLWNFTGGGSDGCNAYSSLIEDPAGALYGTTLNGAGAGTVFRLTPPVAGQTVWSEQVLYGFTGGADGGHPFSTLTFGPNGTLYGTTAFGGASGYGAVFQLTPPVPGQTAWTEQVLYSFTGAADGAAPLFGALLVDSGGALYGTASGGGAARKCGGFGTSGGSVFKLAPPAGGQGAWTQTTLFDFPGGHGGCIPAAGLSADSSGALYGTAEYGGSDKSGTCDVFGCGVVFRLSGTGYQPVQPARGAGVLKGGKL